MHKRISSLTLIILAGLFFAACAGPTAQQPAAQATPTKAAVATPTKAAVEATPTEAPAESKPMTATQAMTATHVVTATKSATESKPMTVTKAMTTTHAMTETHATTGTTGTMTGALVMMHEDAKLGKLLVDAKGMTLYVYDKDTLDKSNCTGDCLKNWPAFTAKAENETITADAAVTGKLGVIKRDDGTYQVAINGMPLYSYVKDTKAGDTTGQGVGEVWWVVGLDGNKITKK